MLSERGGTNGIVTVAFLADARRTGQAWAALGVSARLAVIARLRRLLAGSAAALAATVARSPADTLVAEVLPLAEAARFLLRRAPALLAPRRLRGGRPLWLFGVQASIHREALGAVLILAPGNYPLFLPGAQALQALAAGNAVCVKPAPGCEAPMRALADLLQQAGLPDGVFQVLPPESGEAAVRMGFDHIVLTGSAETGQRVLSAAAATLTPATMELSGSDAVFVLPGADLELVASCLAYGLRLNGGATCIAPRRVFVTDADAAALQGKLLARLPAIPPASVPSAVAARLSALVGKAVADGARLVADGEGRPVVVADARPGMALLNEDVFAPWLALVSVASPEAALAAAAGCPYALGASVFGPPGVAQAMARRLRAGSVCVNDLIVPTADPRLPFGGRGRSGFGSTRGAEGLLAMTVVKTVSERRGRLRPHLAPATANDAALFAGMTALLHGDRRTRWAALRALVAQGRRAAPQA